MMVGKIIIGMARNGGMVAGMIANGRALWAWRDQEWNGQQDRWQDDAWHGQQDSSVVQLPGKHAVHPTRMWVPPLLRCPARILMRGHRQVVREVRKK